MAYDPSIYIPSLGDEIQFNQCIDSVFPASLNFDFFQRLEFDFSGEYDPPLGSGIEFYFGAPPEIGITVEESLSSAYSDVVYCVSGFSVEASLSGTYSGGVDIETVPIIISFPSFSETYSGDPSIDTRPEGWLPYGLSGAIRCPWNPSQAKDESMRSPWGINPNKDGSDRIPWGIGPVKDESVRVSFEDLEPCDESNRIPWGDADPNDKTIRALHGDYPHKDPDSKRIPWGINPADDKSIRCLFELPPRLYKSGVYLWEIQDPKDESNRILWKTPGANDRHHNTVWGKKYYERICLRAYEPPSGDGIILNIHYPIGLIGNGNHIDFFFDRFEYDERCTQREPSGWRDKWPPPDMFGIWYTPHKVAYLMTNECTIVRLPERTVLDVLSISLGIDIDKWCWTFSMELKTKAHVDLITPIGGTYHTIEATINGHIWEFVVERWSESFRFGTRQWTVSGSSKSVELAAPYGETSSRLEETIKTMQQLATDELEYTDWTFDWDTIDELVPAGLFSYSNLTRLDAIKQVTDAIGAKIQTHQSDTVLHVIPRYPVSPWNWAGETPDMILPVAVFQEISREYDYSPAINGVYVSGETQGVIVFVKRTGTDGTPLGQMVTNSLITTEPVGTETGRNILASAGDWTRITLATFLRNNPLEGPGLALPGQLIKVVDPAGDWFAQVVSVNVSAGWTAQGLRVQQTIGVEKYA